MANVFEEIRERINAETAAEVIEAIVFWYSDSITCYDDLAALVGKEGMAQFMTEFEYATYNNEVKSILTLLLERMHDSFYTLEETYPLAKAYVNILAGII